jgi:hypothetical protein
MNLASIWGLSTTIIVFVLGIILLILVGLADSYSKLKEIFYLRRTPTVKISSLPAEGLVQIVGKAEQATAISPVSQTKCVVWNAEVQEYHPRKGGSSWDTAWKGESAVPFELFDETGKVWVDPIHADLFLQKSLKEESGWFENMSPKAQDAIATLGVNTKDLWGLDKNLRVKESMLFSGKKVFVMGTVESRNGQKIIESVGRNPFVISSRGKAFLLPDLYFKVAKPVIKTTLIGGVILLIILFGYSSSGGAH